MIFPEDRMLQKLAAAKWEVVRVEEGSRALPDALVARYNELPPAYVRFVSSIESCVHPAGDSWFPGLRDFDGSLDSAFSWDDFEKQSLEAAEGDDLWQGEIRSYWNQVLPIALSTRSGYSYLGLCLDSANFDAVVLGREPEFEESITIAPSFRDLCQAVVGHLDGHVRGELIDFL